MKDKRSYLTPECVRLYIETIDLIAQSEPTYRTTFTFIVEDGWESPIDGDLSPKFRNTLWEE